MNSQATDWDRYYRHTPKYTSVARSITTRKLLGLLDKYRPEGRLAMCEIGGANSCFVEDICKRLPVERYHVIDLNAFGLSLLQGKRVRTSLTSERSDVLLPYKEREHFDIVFSVGLIEHFDRNGTRSAVHSHFDRCRAGGLVLVTFPTPTLPYRAIRRGAEIAGMWQFPDERPLGFEEVITACRQHGEIMHQSINWWIGLTQGYVVSRKSGDA